jgi:hypothetical protein
VSSKGRRSHTTNEQSVTPFPAERRLRVVKDELDHRGQPFVGGAMSLAPEQCADDRPPGPEGPDLTLRRAREAHALTIEDLARTTKVSKTILTAIETRDVRRLPATIYTRGFVKAYAREVGLDPEKTADEYLAAIAVSAAVDEVAHVPPVTHPPTEQRRATGVANGVGVDNSMGQFGWITTMLAVVGLIAYLGYLGSAGDVTPEDAPVVSTQRADSDAAPAAQAEKLTSDATRAVDGPFRLELRTQGLCWVVISVDGEQVLRRLLQPGEHYTFEVQNEAIMRVGEPGALTLSINGQAGRPIGPAGLPVDVRIDRTNVRQYLGTQ